MSGFMEIFVFFITILQFLFPFAFKDTEVPENPGDDTVIEQVHAHTGGYATCFTRAVCTVCGETYGEIGDHIYNIEVTPATCKTQGYSTYTCKACTESFVADITPFADHKYIDTVVKPTCTDEGYTKHTCRVCTVSIEDTVTAALGHDMQTTVVEATCTEKGYKQDKCSRSGCSYKEAEYDIVNATGHDITTVVTAPTCSIDGFTEEFCSVCGYENIVDRQPATGHRYVNYVTVQTATCKQNTITEAICENNCGVKDIREANDKLPHEDKNNDMLCDHGGEKLEMVYTYLQYPDEIDKNGVSYTTLIDRASATGGSGDVYEQNNGYDSNGVIRSPYYSAKVDGKTVPVYATAVFCGENGGYGAIHSFSEIYVEKGAYATFELVLDKKLSAVPDFTAVSVEPSVTGSVASAQVADRDTLRIVLEGFGTHTVLINGGDQRYAYTIHVREEVDDEAAIQALRDQGYLVYDVDGFIENWKFSCITPGYEGGRSKTAIYLRKGAYVTALHSMDITSDAVNKSTAEGDAMKHNGISLNRYPFVSAHAVNEIKVVGYGVLDLTHLDRAERRGLVISFATDVEVRGVKIINAPEWSLITYRCNNVRIKDVDIYGFRQNSDAFDICNSNDVIVEGCFTRTGDDGFVVKTLGGDAKATSNNVSITNCYAWMGKARAFGIFGETNRNISNVNFKDCVVLCHDAVWDESRIPAIGIIAETGNAENEAVTISNIRFENIRICRNDSATMNCLIFTGLKNFTVTDVTFKNISYAKNNKPNVVVNNGGENANNVLKNIIFDGVTCGGTLLTDANKSTYFEAKAYEGNYIGFANTK